MRHNTSRHVRHLAGWLACSLFGLHVFAQASLRGTVTGTENGEPVPGAAVFIESVSQGAFTDGEGRYLIKGLAPGEYTLRISISSYKELSKAITVRAGDENVADFVLEPFVKELDEILVVGYGVQRKRELVGNVVKITGAELQPNVGSSFETALQGKAAGLQMIQGSGTVGAASTVRVRGTGSISAGGDPLYVVDGIPISQNYNVNQGLGSDVQNNPLQFINPNDIESIEVLKDASAIAIYGSRGANGVILITTKRGTRGKPEFSVSANVGTSQPTVLPEMLTGAEWLQVQQEAWENDGGVGRVPLPNGLTYADITEADGSIRNTDWYSEVLRTGTKQDYNASMKVGGKAYQLYAGASYNNSQGFQIGNGLQRTTGRINVDVTPVKSLTLSLNSSLAGTNVDKIRQQYNGPLGLAMSTALPIYPIRNENGVYFDQYNNPAAQLDLLQWESRELRAVNNARITWKATDRLTFNGTFNHEALNIADYQKEDTLWGGGNSYSKAWFSRIRNYSTYATVNYDFKLPNEQHRLTALAGAEFQSYGRRESSVQFRDLDDFIYAFGQAEDVDTTGITDWIVNNGEVSTDSSVFASVFLRANYAFKDKFLVQATFRRDGSSKFGPNQRFGNFPSLGVGYILTEEAFLADNPVLSYLKLKASWGVSGNSFLSWTEQYATYKLPDVAFQGLYGGDSLRWADKPANPDLRWETINSFDVGFDYGLLKDRITGDFAFYYKRTTDALVATRLQASTGIDNLTFYQNIGTVDNWGVEFNINTRNVQRKFFSWKTNFNISHNNNNVVSNGGIPPDALDGGYGDMRIIEGYPVTTYYIVPFVRIDAESGRPVYLDRDGKETFVYDETQKIGNRAPSGSALPKFYGGITNTFRYKDFDFSFLFVFSYGNKVYDDAAKRYLGVITVGNGAWNYRRDILDHWTPENAEDATYPKLTTTIKNWGNGTGTEWNNNSTLWLRDASYLRLRNIQLGYTYRPLGTGFLRSVRATITGNNLLLFTPLYGLDPETARFQDSDQKRNIGGVGNSYLNSPQEKSVLFGVSLDF